MSWPPFSSAIGSFVIGYSSIQSSPQVTSPPLLGAIRAYAYEEYADDDDILALFQAFNDTAQGYQDWFNSLGLPIYTGLVVADQLLDWVGSGVYGLDRPTLAEEQVRLLGPINTTPINTLAINQLKRVVKASYALATDDVYRRALTWHFWKGDGRAFTVRWLKRRVQRFLDGFNGIGQSVVMTDRVSVSFGADQTITATTFTPVQVLRGAINTLPINTLAIGSLLRASRLISQQTEFVPLTQINITLLTRRTIAIGGAIIGRYLVDSGPINAIRIAAARIGDQFSMAETLKEAIEQGVLELPAQFSYVVNVQS